MEAHFLSYDVYSNLLKDFKHKSDKVEFILEHFPEARNNDNYLIYMYWKLVDRCETLDDVLYATAPEVIRRARQKIQNEKGKYVPTDPEVCRKRKIAEKGFREGISKL
jgi:hypothetical protein